MYVFICDVTNDNLTNSASLSHYTEGKASLPGAATGEKKLLSQCPTYAHYLEPIRASTDIAQNPLYAFFQWKNLNDHML